MRLAARAAAAAGRGGGSYGLRKRDEPAGTTFFSILYFSSGPPRQKHSFYLATQGCDSNVYTPMARASAS